MRRREEAEECLRVLNLHGLLCTVRVGTRVHSIAQHPITAMPITTVHATTEHESGRPGGQRRKLESTGPGVWPEST